MYNVPFLRLRTHARGSGGDFFSVGHMTSFSSTHEEERKRHPFSRPARVPFRYRDPVRMRQHTECLVLLCQMYASPARGSLLDHSRSWSRVSSGTPHEAASWYKQLETRLQRDSSERAIQSRAVSGRPSVIRSSASVDSSGNILPCSVSQSRWHGTTTEDPCREIRRDTVSRATRVHAWKIKWLTGNVCRSMPRTEPTEALPSTCTSRDCRVGGDQPCGGVRSTSRKVLVPFSHLRQDSPVGRMRGDDGVDGSRALRSVVRVSGRRRVDRVGGTGQAGGRGLVAAAAACVAREGCIVPYVREGGNLPSSLVRAYLESVRCVRASWRNPCGDCAECRST